MLFRFCHSEQREGYYLLFTRYLLTVSMTRATIGNVLSNDFANTADRFRRIRKSYCTALRRYWKLGDNNMHHFILLYMNRTLLLLFAVLFAGKPMIAQPMHTNKILPKPVQQSLTLAGTNRPELQKLIVHYSQHKEDSLKLKAAYWLLENMRWHSRNYTEIIPDPQFLKVFHLADSLYYGLVQGKSAHQIKEKATKDSLGKIKAFVQNILTTSSFAEPKIIYADTENATDLQTVRAPFLIDHIDNAFALREQSPVIKQMPLADFFDYLLPYRTIDGQNFRASGKDFNRFFSKYLGRSDSANFPEAIEKYNLAVNNLRYILGQYPLIHRTGFEELFFTKVEGFDCFSISNYGAIALNACGIPVDVEYNSAYQMLQNKHSMCRIAPQFGDWARFSPESGVPVMERESNLQSFKINAEMNIFKINFAPGQHNPWFLKAAGETIPYNLSDPGIEDVTHNSLSVVPLSLPFKESTTNQLCYLATFNSADGMVSVTWAKIDKQNKKALFQNTIPDRLYFPVYYVGEAPQSFGLPFLLKKDSSAAEKYSIVYLDNGLKAESTIDMILTRKFPRKPNMISAAKNLIGTVVMGSDSANFKIRDTLFTLSQELMPYLQDVDIKNTRPYRYYRVEAPFAHPQMNISEIQFLTNTRYQYPNTMEPTPAAVLSPTEAIHIVDTGLTRLIDDEPGKFEWKAEYDGKMTTAPGAYSSITLKLKTPQVVTKIRLAPLNADNGIVPGNEYLLRYWNDGRWNDFEYPQTADYHYLEFKGVPRGKLYWLKNLSGGKEELPFTIDAAGTQQFLYFDIK